MLHTRFFLRLPRHLAGLLLSLSLSLSANVASAQQLTPAQAAFLQTETRKADDQFAKQVAKITGIPLAEVTKAMPAVARISDPVTRLTMTLERNTGKALSDEHKNAIKDADTERRKRITDVTAEARKH